ncbi:MAG: flagellar M-ring protein FliF [Burkholderiaceae bacterium]|nr:flagellar M-ring protein FliF [Burkholderiaceae bacterium]
MEASVTPLTPANAAAELAARQDAPPPSPLQRILALPPRKRWMLIGGVAGLLLVLVAMLTLNRKPDQVALYEGQRMSQEDKGAVLAKLRQMNVPFTVDNGAILVPAAQADSLRMDLATQGVVKGKVGMELLDKQQFGQSANQERAQMIRALSGRLEKMIEQLSGVESAEVQVALASKNGFYREQDKNTAAVIVRMQHGHSLDRSQIAGITSIVAGAVPGLDTKDVSIVDRDGSLLSRSADGDRQDLTKQQREHQRLIEKTLLDRVNEILEPALGKENLRATVTAELDFNQVESTSQAHRPNQTPDAAAVKLQINRERLTNGQALPSGVPGAASNEPGKAPAAPMSGASAPLHAAQMGVIGGGLIKDNQTEYAVDQQVDVTRKAVGGIRRLSVGVVVNHRMVADAKGKLAPQPLPQEELDKLTALVQEAVGFSAERKDTVKVMSLSFLEKPKPEPLPLWQEPWVLELVKNSAVPVSLGIVALALVFGVIRPALAKEKPPEPEAAVDEVIDDLEALPSPEAIEGAGLEPHDPESPERLRILADARVMAKENPLGVANVLKDWMNGEPAKA